jgi:hypothetical protein
VRPPTTTNASTRASSRSTAACRCSAILLCRGSEPRKNSAITPAQHSPAQTPATSSQPATKPVMSEAARGPAWAAAASSASKPDAATGRVRVAKEDVAAQDLAVDRGELGQRVLGLHALRLAMQSESVKRRRAARP